MRHGWTLEKQEWDILPQVIELVTGLDQKQG